MKNIAEILKDCPEGTKLYSPMCGECTLSEVTDYTIRVLDSNANYYNFYFNGYYIKSGECLLFPSKENRDWDMFFPFKDGDVLYIDCNDDEDTYEQNQYIFILKYPLC